MTAPGVTKTQEVAEWYELFRNILRFGTCILMKIDYSNRYDETTHL